MGYYVARELYNKIYSKGKMAIKNITDKVTRTKDKVARELDIKAASKEKFLEENYKATYYNIAFESDYAGFDSHPETEADSEKLSEKEEVKLFTEGLT